MIGFSAAPPHRVVVTLLATVALLHTACSVGAAEPVPASPTRVNAQETLALLDTLAVRGKAAKTDYRREAFGPAWSDDVTVAGGHNGCDSRNDILARDLHNITFKAGTHNCVVQAGTLEDPYTGKTIHFTRGKQSTLVQIDHIVSLGASFQTGAQELSATRRRDFANDPLNLQATDGSANESKGDSDASEWLPPSRRYDCVYIARQIKVKAVYRLWVTAPEKAAMVQALRRC